MKVITFFTPNDSNFHTLLRVQSVRLGKFVLEWAACRSICAFLTQAEKPKRGFLRTQVLGGIFFLQIVGNTQAGKFTSTNVAGKSKYWKRWVSKWAHLSLHTFIGCMVYCYIWLVSYMYESILKAAIRAIPFFLLVLCASVSGWLFYSNSIHRSHCVSVSFP
jgi:hypothetical protein